MLLILSLPHLALLGPYTHVHSRRELLRERLLPAALGAAALSLPGRTAAVDGLEPFTGAGFRLLIPPSYYKPKGGRPRTGLYDDNVFVAADYASGRTLSVSKTDALALLSDSGDTLAATVGPLAELRELGKPAKVAALLTRRREGDPLGRSAQPRAQVVSATRDGNELRFELQVKCELGRKAGGREGVSGLKGGRVVGGRVVGGKGARMVARGQARRAGG